MLNLGTQPNRGRVQIFDHGQRKWGAVYTVSSIGNDAGRGATVNVGTRSGVDEPPTREEDDVARKSGDHRSTGGHHDGIPMRSGRLLWQERQDPVQGLRSRPENRGRQAEVQADETSKTAGDTGDDGVAFTGGAVAPSPSTVVRGNGSVGERVGHYVRMFVAAVVLLGCAVLLCCTALFGKHAGTMKECVSMMASPHAVKIAPPLPLPRTPGAGKEESGTSVAFRGGGNKGCTAQPGAKGRGGHAFLRDWSAAVLSIISVGGVSVASVRLGRGSLISHGARRASSSRRRRRWWWLRSAMVGLAVMSSGCGVGVSAAECTASTCCNVVIPDLPSTTTNIDSSVCNQGT